LLKITNDFTEVAADPNAVIAFTASWCQPCRFLKPELVKASVKTDRNIYIVDVDELDPAVLDSFSIRGIPQVYAKAGEDSWVSVTGRTESTILSEIG
jgi:thioredoxin-like negative regulator of GroEL